MVDLMNRGDPGSKQDQTDPASAGPDTNDEGDGHADHTPRAECGG